MVLIGLAGGVGAGTPLIVAHGPTSRQVAGGFVLGGGLALLIAGCWVAGISHDVTEGATTTLLRF